MSAAVCGSQKNNFALAAPAFYLFCVSSKHERIAALTASFSVGGVDPRYAGFFALFNRQQFYEAHDVLEDLWLADRHGADGDFYKGLIQLAGAFVHLQKNRLRPSAALLQLAQANLEKYPAQHAQLDLKIVLSLIAGWRRQLEDGGFVVNPLSATNVPELKLSA